MKVTVHEAHWSELPAGLAYRLAALRSMVFVVEQHCPYLDLDGRDLELAARQCWIESAPERPAATLRVLGEGGGPTTPVWRIGRVVTDPERRGEGLASALMEHALRRDGRFVLEAQSHLRGWYGTFGFVESGNEFLLDGIPHIPMQRP